MDAGRPRGAAGEEENPGGQTCQVSCTAPHTPTKVPSGLRWLGRATGGGGASWQRGLTRHLDVRDLWGISPSQPPANACNSFQPRGWKGLVAEAHLIWRQSLN